MYITIDTFITMLMHPQAALLDSLYGTERGLTARSEVRAEINELISQLEAQNPTPNPTEVGVLTLCCFWSEPGACCGAAGFGGEQKPRAAAAPPPPPHTHQVFTESHTHIHAHTRMPLVHAGHGPHLRQVESHVVMYTSNYRYAYGTYSYRHNTHTNTYIHRPWTASPASGSSCTPPTQS